jgi:hypothetical protein
MHAREGVISGTGSGAVNPVGGYADVVRISGVSRNVFCSRRRHLRS